MRTLKTPLSVTSSAIALSLLLSACSSDGTVTTLAAGEPVTIGLPQILLNADFLVQDNISPTILLSNGASVTMQKGEGDDWSGTINVAPATQYTATVMWAEFFAGQSLPLASLEQTLDVAADGTVNTSAAANVYSTAIDTDGDLTSNFDERENGTDPFTADIQNSPANNDQPETPVQENSEPQVNTSQGQTIELVATPAAPTETPLSAVADFPNQTVIDTITTPDSTLTPVTTPSPALTPTPDQEDSTESQSPAEPAETTPDLVVANADTVVPRIATSDAPEIDGNDVEIDRNGKLTGEWAAAVQHDSSGAPLYIDNLIIDINAENPDGTAYRRWAAMHDGTHLYVVVIVDDNGDRQRDSLSDLTQDDSLELFMDGDNSKSSSYGSDDFHRIFPVRLPGVDKRSADKGDVAGPNSSSAGLIVTFATGPGVGPPGIRRANWEQDVYELKIDLPSAGIDTDEAFGFELQVNDDDGGGRRDSKWAWKHPSRTTSDVDGTVDNPSTMGTLKLD